MHSRSQSVSQAGRPVSQSDTPTVLPHAPVHCKLSGWRRAGGEENKREKSGGGGDDKKKTTHFLWVRKQLKRRRLKLSKRCVCGGALVSEDSLCGKRPRLLGDSCA